MVSQNSYSHVGTSSKVTRDMHRRLLGTVPKTKPLDLSEQNPPPIWFQKASWLKMETGGDWGCVMSQYATIPQNADPRRHPGRWDPGCWTACWCSSPWCWTICCWTLPFFDSVLTSTNYEHMLFRFFPLTRMLSWQLFSTLLHFETDMLDFNILDLLWSQSW